MLACQSSLCFIKFCTFYGLSTLVAENGDFVPETGYFVSRQRRFCCRKRLLCLQKRQVPFPATKSPVSGDKVDRNGNIIACGSGRVTAWRIPVYTPHGHCLVACPHFVAENGDFVSENRRFCCRFRWDACYEVQSYKHGRVLFSVWW